MIKIGVTGGIGSGKSTVCKIFESLNFPVYYADDRARQVMTSNKNVKHQIISLFGKEAYHNNGRLNKDHLSAAIFANPGLRKQLNNIVHPAVIEDGIKWMENQTAAIVVKEAALLIESGSYKAMDYIILVTCPEEIRINRVMKRNKLSREQVENRIKSQLSEAQMMPYADFIVVNDGSQSLISQTLQILKKIKAKKKRP